MLEEIIRIENEYEVGWVPQAVEILDSGGVVAFPTETVYGLATAPGKPGALDKLNGLKRRSPDKPYTVHVGSADQLYAYVPNPPWLGRVLAKKAWPGPLTLVFELTPEQLEDRQKEFGPVFEHLYYRNTIGVRCPDHPVAVNLLRACDFPVVAPSANPADQPPALDAGQVAEYFGGQVDLILDGGPVKYRQASTVLKVSSCGYQILREGIIDSRMLDRLAAFTVLFVCTGNTCRSPMAQVLGEKIFARLIGCDREKLSDLSVKIVSAGTMAGWEVPASHGSIYAMNQLGIDLTGHRSQPLTPNLIGQADVIFAMSQEHKDFICDLVPDACRRIILLSETGVPDPIGGSDQEYLACARNLEHLIEARLKELFE